MKFSGHGDECVERAEEKWEIYSTKVASQPAYLLAERASRR
jgi:hypothetical protein